MKIKSMIAALAASALAVCAMSLSASAKVANPNNDKGDTYQVAINETVDNYYELQGCKVTLKMADGWEKTGAGGGVCFQGEGRSWDDGVKEFGVSGEGVDCKNISGITIGAEGDNTVYVVYDNGSAMFENCKDNEKAWAQLAVQGWWGADFTVENVEYFYVGDAVPTVPQKEPAPAETEAPATTAEDKKDDTASTTTKDNGKKTDSAKGSGTSTDAAKTGDAGVGVAIAALSLAGAAAFVARRKH